MENKNTEEKVVVATEGTQPCTHRYGKPIHDPQKRRIVTKFDVTQVGPYNFKVVPLEYKEETLDCWTQICQCCGHKVYTYKTMRKRERNKRKKK